MNSKSRVYAALRREPTDRVPIWMWLHPETTLKLSRILEIPPTMVATALGDDIRQTWVGNNFAMEGITHPHDGDTHTDVWGIEWVKEGYFNQIRRSPLVSANDEELQKYNYPYEYVPQLLENMVPVMANADKFFIGCDISPCLFEMVWRLRGMEETLLDLATRPEIAENMLQKAAAFSAYLAEAACQRFSFDWLWTGDDVGGQHAMLMSPQCWREMIRPKLANILSVAKKYGRINAFHSCGAIRPIIPDLIEIGVDVLNPIQCNCPGMSPIELKREFGSVLSFMGGIDTQQMLPKGSPSEIRKYTTHLIEKMTADGGGYILAASHLVPPETPLENIFAMYEAAGVSREEIFDRAATLRHQNKINSHKPS